MNKLTKLLSLLVVAGAMAGAVTAAGCTHKHSYLSDWEADKDYHWHEAACGHKGQKGAKAKHVDSDENGICDVCKYNFETGSIMGDGKLGKDDFAAILDATLNAPNFTYTYGEQSVKVDGALNAFELAGGAYVIYDSFTGKLTQYAPLADVAWEEIDVDGTYASFAEAKQSLTGGMNAALTAFKEADYSTVEYDSDTGVYTLGDAYLTIDGLYVGTYGDGQGETKLTAFASTVIDLPDFDLVFQNIVSVKIAKLMTGTKLSAWSSDVGFGVFADPLMATATDYVTATAEGFKPTVTTVDEKMRGTGPFISLNKLEGDIEGYFEFTPTKVGSKQNVMMLLSGGNEILTLRTNEDDAKGFNKVLNANVSGATKVSGVTPAANQLYKVSFKFTKESATANYKAYITVNGVTFTDGDDLGVKTLDGFRFGCSNVKSPIESNVRVTIIDNVIICGTPAAGYVNVEGISLNKFETRIVNVGDTETLEVTLSPSTATDKSVIWISSDTSVATVNNGVVTAVKEGTAVISAIAANGKTVQCVVNVGEPPKEMHTVTFISEGQVITTATAEDGTTVLQPTGIVRTGYTLVGWAVGSANGSLFDFTTPIERNLTLYAVWKADTAGGSTGGNQGGSTGGNQGGTIGGEPPVVSDPDKVNPPINNAEITHFYAANESVAIEWDENNISAVKVEYKLVSESAYKTVDKELIRQIDEDTARVDILGLKGGATYDFKITTSAKKTLEENGVTVSAYDRSGYAHFNYKQGVGAYNDDGTLKDNAIVIYVTDENKDYVMRDYIAANPGVLKMFQIPGNDWDEKNADGIGWWLNNNQYTASNAGSSKNKSPSNTYDSVNGSKLGFKSTDRPIVVRFIGEVTTPEGCTAYNSVNEGGGVGDNGHMARLKNLKNVTLEGVGEGAVIRGWGFHFVIGTDAKNGEGTSFEVRNLTFFEYPEDAIGMEGQQSGSTITAPVERCWIHHNTFLPGRCDNPAESDKKEGDGSCDFKRGQYFTASYNWFEYCHKTNLIGSSDSSLQFNMTYHHNVWWQCGSRIPLTRQANVHFYNNYVYGDSTESTTPYSWIAKPSLSYVHSLRANCYLFSEANYYEGCKQITDGKNGGAGKAWNNVYLNNFSTNTLVAATTREQKVANSCKYGSTDYSSFDTNPNQFYYDAANNKSNCLLTDAVTARRDCLLFSGVQKHNYDINTSMVSSANRPSAALNVDKDGLTIDLKKATVGGTVDGVKFINAKNSSGVAKGKGMLATFTVAEDTEITIKGGTTGDAAIELVREDGFVVAGKLTSFTGTLKAGTYFVTAGQKDKDGTITELSFRSGLTDAEKVQNVINYINAIGTVDLSTDCADRIAMAQSAYYALSAELRKQVTNADVLATKAQQYDQLVAGEVIKLINAIGTVGVNSGTKIAAARAAYNALTVEQQSRVSNYQTLVSAESAYEGFKVQGLNAAITALATPSSVSGEEAILALLDEYYNVQTMYEALSDSQRAQVVGYSKVTDGITALEKAAAPYEVIRMIAALPAKADVTLADSAAVNAARAAYNALDAAGKTLVGSITKLTEAEAVISDLASRSRVAIFDKNKPELATAGEFTVSSGNYKGTSQKFTYNGVEYNSPLKMESSTKVSFNTSSKMKLTLFLHADGKQSIKVDGVSYTASNGIVEIEIEKGDNHTITQGSGQAFLCYAVLTPMS